MRGAAGPPRANERGSLREFVLNEIELLGAVVAGLHAERKNAAMETMPTDEQGTNHGSMIA